MQPEQSLSLVGRSTRTWIPSAGGCRHVWLLVMQGGLVVLRGGFARTPIKDSGRGGKVRSTRRSVRGVMKPCVVTGPNEGQTPAAPATHARALTADRLAELTRATRQQLVRALLVERGVRVTRVQPRGEADDLYVSLTAVWRSRQGRVRVVYRSVDEGDIAALAEVATAEDLADAVLIEAAPHQGPVVVGAGPVQLIGAEALVAFLQSSALPAWAEGMPAVEIDRFRLWTGLQEQATIADPSGLRWLPTLALDKLPAELAGAGQAHDLFELLTFRVLTRIFRFSGTRLGAAVRGERKPDALLRSPGCVSRHRVIMDCKAAQDGYRMGVDDERALTEYCDELREDHDPEGLSHVLIVSSQFQGQAGAAHPFHARARAITRHGAGLAYIAATDLVSLAIEMDRRELSPETREQYPWRTVLDLGMPSRDDLLASLEVLT